MLQPVLPEAFTDWMYMAKTVFGEVRGEAEATRRAVAWVIRNRARDPAHRFGQSVWEVVTRPRQFSCWNRGDPNRETILHPMGSRPERKAWLECVWVSWQVLSASEGDNPIPGVYHYHDTSIPAPPWTRGLEPLSVPGVTRLRFYRDPGWASEPAGDRPADAGAADDRAEVDRLG